ncbi:MAG TPA: metallophosphoesterase [Solirubrobacteraceae bacterium]
MSARTLVVSDFHLGARLEHDVLRHTEPLQRLLAALDDVERLVLLGDIVELMEGRATAAMRIAEPVLRAIGTRLGPDREVLLVPGNHDGPLVRPWVRRVGARLDPTTEVPLDATAVLARVVSLLGPARVRVSYPGAWIADGVWATHGHYLDRHLMPDSSVGILRGRQPADRVRPNNYERVRRPSLSRTSRMFPQSLARLLSDAADLTRAATMPALTRGLLHRRFAPLTSMVLGLQMRYAGIPALTRVVQRLGVEADHVLFGHVHRLGPLPDDDPAHWAGPDGAPRILNTGSWLFEPLLVHRVTPPHPYWPGGAVLLEPGAEPRAVGLLDEVAAEALRPRSQGRIR